MQVMSNLACIIDHRSIGSGLADSKKSSYWPNRMHYLRLSQGE